MLFTFFIVTGRLCAASLCLMLFVPSPPAVAIDTGVKAGLEFGHPNPGHRRLRLMAEWYKGFDPHGQFYNNKVEYYGMGVSLGF